MKYKFLLASSMLLSVASCQTEPTGQIMLAMRTDMSLPKDIDRVRIEVTYTDSGAFAYQRDFERMGSEDSIRLPATLGFIAPEDRTRAIRVRLIASRGSDESVRVLRDIVTTVPADRIAMLPIPIEFLCDGSAEPERDANGKVKRDASGNVIVKSACPGELTCQAGTCVSPEIDSATLAEYKEAEVFGGGNGKGNGACFDTAKCFETTTPVLIDPADLVVGTTSCRATISGNASAVNIGLQTQGGGMCGPNGCFIALDFDSDAGWKSTGNGTIALPSAVCEKIVQGKIAGIVSAPVTSTPCDQKRAAIPTCGPWSASGAQYNKPPAVDDAVYVIAGQVNPTALGLSADHIYWTAQGTFDDNGVYQNDGVVKVARKAGGEPTLVASGQGAPQGIAVDVPRQFVLWTNAVGANGGSIGWAPFGEPLKSPWGGLLRDNLDQPAGIAVQGSTAYFADVTGGAFSFSTEVVGDNLALPAGSMLQKLPNADPASISPRAVTLAQDAACFAYEGKLTEINGVIECEIAAASFVLATGQATPRSIAMQRDASGNAVAVYWANFDAKSTDPLTPRGSVNRVQINGGMPAPAEVLAHVDYPAGIAFDDATNILYFTGSGEVLRLDPGTNVPKVIAAKRKNPGAIAVDESFVFWIDEGTPGKADGAILRAPK
jgi:hypothetical protein